MIKKKGLYFPTKEFKKRAWLRDDSIYEKADDPVNFWQELAEKLYWYKKWRKGFSYKSLNLKWFVGGKINITANIFEKDFEKKKDKIALIWEPEPFQEKSRFLTYGQLFKEVCRLANALKKLGVKRGDRVGIYLPMIPEIAISMLACARIGAVHSIVFSAFSPTALKIRLEDTGAKVLITADGYYRRGEIINLKGNADQGIEGTRIEKVICVRRAKNKIPWNTERDFWYQELIKNEKDFCQAEVMDAEDLLFILYTSGSTGRPKGCCHVCGGYTVQAHWTGKWIFDWHPEDIFWCTADIGWITGHTYGVYSPLLNGVSTLLFEGVFDYPEPDRWAKIVEKHKVTIFYTAPTAIRTLERYGVQWVRKHKLETLRLLGSVGEPIDEAAWQWYFKEVGKGRCPVVDTWWQTETGGILITSLPGIGPFKPAFTGLPFPGFKFDILDEKGKSCPASKVGRLVLLSPFAPSLLRGIYKNLQKYKEIYWSQYGDNVYFTNDGAFKDESGLIRIVGRVDDAIKVAGHRLSTGELEAAINLHPEVDECAVIGVPDKIKGEAPVAFVIPSTKRPASEIKEESIKQLRKVIGPIATPKEVYVVEDLPKTRSGKIMRRVLRGLLTGEELGDLSTIANPEIVERIKKVIRQSVA